MLDSGFELTTLGLSDLCCHMSTTTFHQTKPDYKGMYRLNGLLVYNAANFCLPLCILGAADGK